MGETATAQELRRLALCLLHQVERHSLDYHHKTPPGLLAEARQVLGLDEPAQPVHGARPSGPVEDTQGIPQGEEP